jgi:hypothetical protein
MKRERLLPLLSVIIALHVFVLSVVFGVRHLGYMLTATLSATLIWALVYFVNREKRRPAMIIGLALGIAIQQAAQQILQTELTGFWWPLAQFGALQFLVAHGLGRSAP